MRRSQMSSRRRYTALTLSAISIVMLVAAGPTSADPRRTVPTPELASALHCQGELSRADQAVLLVPGTGSDGSYLFPQGFQVELSASGVPSCYLDIPGHTLDDMQVSVQYVVFALRQMANRVPHRVAIYGFSQGGVLARMALTFWPSTRHLVSDVVSASAPQHGSTNIPSDYCQTFGCPAAGWQRLPTSHLLAVLNEGDETPGGSVNWTTLRTLDDTMAVPADGPNPTSALQGASNLVIQDICPGRQVRHLDMAFDAVAYAALRDAMLQAGPAEANRLRAGQTCDRQYVGHVTPDYVTAVNSRIIQNILSAPVLMEDPPVTIRRRS
jgi:triacylglycerol lipase